MRVLNVISAGATWLFDIADLNPKGKSVFPEMLDWLKDTYNFKKAPESPKDLDENKGLTFEDGEFQAREEVFVDVHLKIFTDGLVARSSSSTEDTDRFLENLISSAVAEFSLSFDPNMIRRKIYLSELIVRLDNSLGNINPQLVTFAGKLSAVCPDSMPFEVGGISFWADSTYAVTKVTPFTIERKVNAPFNENKFYTKAPLQTEQHKALLSELDSILVPALAP